MSSTRLIHGGAIVTVNESHDVLDPGWIVIRDETIVDIGSGEPPSELEASVDEVISAAGCAVMPGMTNAHTHLFQSFFRGLADDRPLLDWLRECIWPAAEHITPEIAYHAARIGLLENLMTGCTSVIDHQYVHPGVDGDLIDDAVCRAADELGIRLLLAHGWADRNYHEPLAEDAATAIRRAKQAYDRWDGHEGRIKIELGPLIPWGCSDEAMTETIAAARSWGRGTHVHCAETAVEVEMSVAERGMRHVPWLASVGSLASDVQLAHAVWLDDDELQSIANADAVVVHCPVSNMYLASGVARILDMRELGITVALASDGSGSNNRQDLFEAMKVSVLLQKVHHLNAMALQPEDAIEMACVGGARAFGEPDRLGRIEVGRDADIVIVNLDHPTVAPVHRVPSALVFNCSPQQVRDVFVQGEPVIRNGHHRAVDTSEVVSSAKTAAAALFQQAGIQSRLG